MVTKLNHVRVIQMTRDVLNAPSVVDRPKVVWTFIEKSLMAVMSLAKSVNCWDPLTFKSRAISSEAFA